MKRFFYFIAYTVFKHLRSLILWKRGVNYSTPLKLENEFLARYSSMEKLIGSLSDLGIIFSHESFDLASSQTNYLNIVEELSQSMYLFDGRYFQCGSLDKEATVLHAILGRKRDQHILEVGVANGYSSRFVYENLKMWGGSVTSIDWPRFSNPNPDFKQRVIAYAHKNKWFKDTGTIVDLREGGVVPAEKYASWLVPCALKSSVNSLSLYGNVFNILPDVEATYDVIILDAMKSYDQRITLLNLALARLRKGGVIIFDGYWVNNAFSDFCEEKGIEWASYGKVGVAVDCREGEEL